MENRLQGDAGAALGAARAVARADAASPGWSERALNHIAKNAVRGRLFTCPEFRERAYAEGLDRPTSNLAWGGPIRRAAKEGIIRPAGYTEYGDETMHTQSVKVWVYS